MDVRFRTRRLQRVFNSHAELVRIYGDRLTHTIEIRMAVLIAAANLGQVPVTRPIRLHGLSGHRRGQFAIDLVHPDRLVLRPDHNPLPSKADGGIDRNAVTAIEIVEIVDDH